MPTLPLMFAQAPDPGATALTAIAYLALEWTIRLVLVPIIIRKHRPSEALAWLALTLFQPIPGAIVYVILGRQLLGRKRTRAYTRAIELVETPERTEALTPHIAPPERIDPGYRDLFRLASKVGQSHALIGNRGVVVQHTEQVIERLIEDIDRAEHSVHLLYYIFLPDATGSRVADALRRAAARGVECRVLVDGVGSSRMLKSMAPGLRRDGVEVRAALPVKLFRRPLARIDVRNHRKLAVIDGRVAYAGSQNICDANYGHASIGAWHDLTARITGPIVYQLQMLFCEDWAAETGAIPDSPHVFPAPEPDGEVVAQMIPSGPGARNQAFRDLILSAINEADERVVMVTPYFVPDSPTLLALVLRAMAGVRVDVIVPEKTNSVLVNAAAKSIFEELLHAGANIHLHREGLLHVKAMTIDDRFALFGSGNFDRRSFFLNYELNLLVLGTEVATSLQSHLLSYVDQSRPLEIAELDKRPWIQKLADDTAKLVAPLL